MKLRLGILGVGFGDGAGECLIGDEKGPGPADDAGRLKLPPYGGLKVVACAFEA
jgi:hypothetical protein